MKSTPKSQTYAKLGFVAVVLALLGFFIWWQTRPVPEYRWTGTFLGHPWLVTTKDRAVTPRIKALLDGNIPEVLARLELRYSRDPRIGIVAEFNASTSTLPANVGVELYRTVNIAKRLSQTTPAADITTATLQDLWKRVRTGAIPPPPPEGIAALLAETGMDRISAPAESYIRKFKPGIAIAVEPWAEGYAADRIEILMLEQKIENFTCQIGGTVLVRASPGLTTQIPINFAPGATPISTTRVTLASGQLVTRGPGDGYLHLDPRTGRPVTNNVRAVTVLAENALISAALANILYVLGPEAGLPWLEKNGVAHGTAIYHLEIPGKGLVRVSNRYQQPPKKP